jgi:uncharacterized protein (TIGR03437 family)
MMRIAASAMFCAAASAQILSLSTNEGGSQLCFTTKLRQRGTDQLFTPKLYVIDAAGLRLLEQRKAEYFGPVSNDYIFAGRDLSADGTVQATNTEATCFGGSSCLFREKLYTEFTTRAVSVRFGGHGQVSSNGRWGLTWGSTGISTDPAIPIGALTRVDLATGKRAAVGREPAVGGHWIASDGSILTRTLDQWSLARLDGSTPVRFTAPPEWAVLADSGGLIAYEARSEIRLLRAAGGSDQVVGAGQRPSLSRDGSRLAYLGHAGDGTEQVFFCFTVACTPRQITFEPEGIRETVLNGNGGLAFSVTTHNRVIGVDVGNGFRSEYLGPAPELPASPLTVVPGSSYALESSFLTEDPAAVQVWAAGRTAPVLAVSRDRLDYQVPWDAPVGDDAGVLLWSGEPQWEAAAADGIESFLPVPVGLGMFGEYAIHEDWHGLVTADDPASSGEVVHFYAQGLGPVDRSVETGKPSPVARVTTQLRWLYCVEGILGSLDSLYAGLAPGTIGYYQIDLRIPAGLGGQPLNPAVEDGSGTYSFPPIDVRPWPVSDML